MSTLTTWLTDKLLRRVISRWVAQTDGKATEWLRHASSRMLVYGQILNRGVAAPSLDKLPVSEIQSYVKELNTRNKAMGSPVKIQGAMYDMSLVDWFEVERQLNLSKVQSVPTTLSIGYDIMATALPEKPAFTLFPKSEPAMLYRAFNYGIIGVGLLSMFSLLQRVPILFGILVGGLALGVAGHRVLSEILSNGRDLAYFENTLSTTWDEVLSNTTEGNILLVSLLTKFIEAWPLNEVPMPEFYEWTPAQTLRFLSYAMTEDHQLSAAVKKDAIALIKSYMSSGNVNAKRSALYHQLDMSSFGEGEPSSDTATKSPVVNFSEAAKNVYEYLLGDITRK